MCHVSSSTSALRSTHTHLAVSLRLVRYASGSSPGSFRDSVLMRPSSKGPRRIRIHNGSVDIGLQYHQELVRTLGYLRYGSAHGNSLVPSGLEYCTSRTMYVHTNRAYGLCLYTVQYCLSNFSPGGGVNILPSPHNLPEHTFPPPPFLHNVFPFITYVTHVIDCPSAHIHTPNYV
jgi:hypothetical protein